MKNATIQLFFFILFGFLRACTLASLITISGISFMDAVINRGTRIRSSKIPRTGIKSGIKSIGLNKYPTVIPINSFAVQGVRGSEYAIIKTWISDLNFFTFAFNL